MDDGGDEHRGYDVETLFWRAQCGERPADMSPDDAATFDRFVEVLAKHPNAVMPLHFD